MKLEAGTKGFLLDGIPYVKGKYEPLVRGNNVGVCYREEGKAYELVYPIPFGDWVDENDTPYVSVQALLDSMETLFFLAANSGGGVTSVSGGLVDNTDPSNPTIDLSNGSGTAANGTAVNLGGNVTQNTDLTLTDKRFFLNFSDTIGSAVGIFRISMESINNANPGYFAIRPADEGVGQHWAEVPYATINRLPFFQINGLNGWIGLLKQLETHTGENDPVITDYILKRLTPSPEASILFEDFNNGVIGSKYEAFTSGIGASVLPIQISDAGRSGVVALSTGTTSTGRAAIATNIDSECANGGVILFRASFYIPTLSTAIERYVLRIGGGDVVSGDFTDGIYIEYDDSVSPNWRGCTANNASRTKSNPVAIPVTVGWNTVSIEVSITGFSATFKVNDVILANNVLNIPKTPARSFGWMLSIIKSVGTTARSVNVDWIDPKKEFATSRY